MALILIAGKRDSLLSKALPRTRICNQYVIVFIKTNHLFINDVFFFSSIFKTALGWAIWEESKFGLRKGWR